MISQILLVTGCAIFGIFGGLHFVYVLATNKFDVIDRDLVKSMKVSNPVITKETSLWQAWIGINYSHSLGLLWISFIYIPLIIGHFEVLQNNMWLTLLLPVSALCYAILSKKYWFTAPFVGSVLAFVCFAAGFYLLHFD